LEFGTDNQIFGLAQEVEYLADYPKWVPHEIAQPGASHILLTKSDAWRYEREYRVIGLGDSIERSFSPGPLLLNGNFLSFPSHAVEAVIVGCEADYEAVVEVVRPVAPNISIKRAVRSPTQYRLQIIAVD
jgi:hypothetical protein